MTVPIKNKRLKKKCFAYKMCTPLLYTLHLPLPCTVRLLKLKILLGVKFVFLSDVQN